MKVLTYMSLTFRAALDESYETKVL